MEGSGQLALPEVMTVGGGRVIRVTVGVGGRVTRVTYAHVSDVHGRIPPFCSPPPSCVQVLQKLGAAESSLQLSDTHMRAIFSASSPPFAPLHPPVFRCFRSWARSSHHCSCPTHTCAPCSPPSTRTRTASWTGSRWCPLSATRSSTSSARRTSRGCLSRHSPEDQQPEGKKRGARIL